MSNILHIYVDGSYNIKTKESGWAYLIINQDTFPNKLVAKGKVKDSLNGRNVTGELAAMQNVFSYLKYKYTLKHLNEIYIYYDYLGIEYWATNIWQTKKLLTFQYKEHYDKFIKYFPNLKINWIKVKSHSGNNLNEEVDKLAKAACGVK